MGTSYNAFTGFGLKLKFNISALRKMVLANATGVTVTMVAKTQSDELQKSVIAKHSQPGTNHIVILYRSYDQISKPRFDQSNGKKLPDLITEVDAHAWVLLNGNVVEEWYNFNDSTKAFLAKPSLSEFVKRITDVSEWSEFFNLLPGITGVFRESGVFITTPDLVFSCSQHDNDWSPMTASFAQIQDANTKLSKVALQLEGYGFQKSEPRLFAEYTAD